MTGAWTEQEIADEAQSSLARLVLAEDLSGAVLGYALGWEVAGETQILRVAVGASHRRQGLGRAQAKGRAVLGAHRDSRPFGGGGASGSPTTRTGTAARRGVIQAS